MQNMGNAFEKLLGLGLAMGAATLSGPALARDDPPPPPPCPLTGTLRVADTASLTSIKSLSQCTTIVVAPARPDERMRLPDVRIAPSDADRPRRTDASIVLASADAAKVPPFSAAAQPTAAAVDVKAIAPKRDEPAALPQLDPTAILAMRPVSYATPYDAMIGRVAARHRIDPLLLHAVIDQESRYQARATSPAGARGLMQLMPGTARMLNVRGAAIVDAEANVDGGARLLRQLHGRFNDFNLTLAAYNAGEGAVRRYGNQVPPYPETQNYVRGVMARYERLVAEQAAGAR
jgi:soluble lytic murein transglycosylase-like protein